MAFTKELLEQIKNVTAKILFQKEKEVEEVAVDFKTEKLKDSEIEIKYSEMAVGSPVFKTSADGDVPAENGDYTTDSGVSFKVVDGLISEIIEAPEAEVEAEDLAKEDVEKPAEEAKPDEPKADNSELLQKIESLEAEIASIKEALDKPKEDSKRDEAFAKLDNDVKALAELFSAIAKIPVEFSKTDNRAETADSKNDALKALADIISMKK